MNETTNGNDSWKSAAKAARDGLADAAGQRIADAETHIAAASRADTEAEALAELDRAAEANGGADRIIAAGIEAGEAEALTAITAAFRRGLDPTEL